jgi:ATP-dependent DNA helicase DinG
MICFVGRQQPSSPAPRSRAAAPDAVRGSATIQFLASRLGLDDQELEPRTGVFPSPFRYREQAILAVPSDAPAPNMDAQWTPASVTRIAIDLGTAANGGMFVLFTSHRDVQAVAAELRARGIERRWPLLVHET